MKVELFILGGQKTEEKEGMVDRLRGNAEREMREGEQRGDRDRDREKESETKEN